MLNSITFCDCGRSIIRYIYFEHVCVPTNTTKGFNMVEDLVCIIYISVLHHCSDSAFYKLMLPLLEVFFIELFSF